MNKFCINCGQQINADAQFCPFCGAIQAAMQPSPVAPIGQGSVLINSPRKKHPVMITIIVGIVIVLIGWVTVTLYQNNQRNNMTEQQVANVGAETASKYFGSQVIVSYSNDDNAFTVVPKSDSALEQKIESVALLEEPASSVSKYRTKLKDLARDLADKVPDKDKNYEVYLRTSDNYYYRIKNDRVLYDFTRDL